ncbi:hypothetical protein BDV93DRAFT_138547 [Ceratobasidium sp. AG-I]|nr:hypothetical protein BDV93DRAFT_138547 [Ceratobasidium sp. AG-I]
MMISNTSHRTFTHAQMWAELSILIVLGAVVFLYPTRAAHPALPVPRFGACTPHRHLIQHTTPLAHCTQRSGPCFWVAGDALNRAFLIPTLQLRRASPPCHFTLVSFTKAPGSAISPSVRSAYSPAGLVDQLRSYEEVWQYRVATFTYRNAGVVRITHAVLAKVSHYITMLSHHRRWWWGKKRETSGQHT